MKKYKFIFALSAIATLSFTSCNDMLTEKPDSFYEEEQFFTSVDNAKMAVVGIYDSFAKLGHYGQSEMAMPSSDDTYYIQGTGTDNTRRDISHYMVKTTNTWVESVWEFKMQGIDRANYTIAKIKAMPDYENSASLKALVGEASFLRAFLAFDLIKYWGDAPFKTTYTSKREDAFQPRKNRELIYDDIIKDLDFAKENLPWSNGSTSPEKATQGAARALLMRVWLQRAGYSLQMDGKLTRPDEAKSQEYFRAVIKEWEAFKNQSYHNFYSSGYLDMFKGFSYGTLDSQESLFEIAFYNATGEAEDSGTWGTYNGPLVDAPGIKAGEMNKFMGRANAFFRVIPEWKGFFEETDERRDVMVCTYKYVWDKASYSHVKKAQANGKDWYPGKWRREWMPIGFKEPNNTDVNFSPLRYADVVLMAAEAYNETGDSPMAWELLNKVRNRSKATPINTSNYAALMKAPKVLDLPFIDDSTEKGKFRTALYWERGFELAFEGQRKYDLIRWGVLAEAIQLIGKKTSVNKVSAGKEPFAAVNNFRKGQHELFPIPLSEMQSNPELKNIQNPGY